MLINNCRGKMSIDIWLFLECYIVPYFITADIEIACRF